MSTIRSSSLLALFCVVFLTFNARSAHAQIITGNGFGGAPGVYLDVDGKVRVRQVDQGNELNARRARLKAGTDNKNEKFAYLSLPKLFSQVRTLRSAGKPIPEELRFLGGLTQIRYVFVYPQEHDLVIGGPAEPWQLVHGTGDAVEYVVGKRTGRPVLQLDDLVVGLRTAREGGGNLFGCGIYPSPESLKIADDIAHRMARATRAERMQALREGLGPQTVRIFGTKNDTRFAYICVAADYLLKQFALGTEHAPVPGLGSAIDHSRSAANQYWFQADYEPLLVSKDGNSYEIRGQRLATDCGAIEFDPRGATETAKRFTVQFSKSIPTLAMCIPLFAELQNVADEAFLGNLLRRDRLAERVGWDNSWIFDNNELPVAHVPVPRTCDTIVSFTNGSMVAGGVVLTLGPWVESSHRQGDEKQTLDTPRQRFVQMREAKETSASSGESIFQER